MYTVKTSVLDGMKSLILKSGDFTPKVVNAAKECAFVLVKSKVMSDAGLGRFVKSSLESPSIKFLGVALGGRTTNQSIKHLLGVGDLSVVVQLRKESEATWQAIKGMGDRLIGVDFVKRPDIENSHIAECIRDFKPEMFGVKGCPNVSWEGLCHLSKHSTLGSLALRDVTLTKGQLHQILAGKSQLDLSLSRINGLDETWSLPKMSIDELEVKEMPLGKPFFDSLGSVGKIRFNKISNLAKILPGQNLGSVAKVSFKNCPGLTRRQAEIFASAHRNVIVQWNEQVIRHALQSKL